MQKVQTGLSRTSPSQEQAVVPKTEGKAIRVLLIGGDQREAFLIRKKLTQTRIGAFSLEYTDKLSAGLERLAMGGINVLLLDPGVPDGRRLESITRIRARYPSVPIIILSAQDNEKEKAESLKKGAQDYLAKGKTTTEVLIGSIQRAITNRQPAAKADPEPMDPETVESHFDSIIINNPDGIIIVDRQGKVCFANPAVELLFGCKAERLMGEPLDSLVAVNGGKTEFSIVRPNGEKRTAEVRVVEMKYRGEPAFLASLRDITERKKVEEDTRKALTEAESARANAIVESTQAREESKRTKMETETARVALDNLAQEIRTAREETKEIKSSHLKFSKAIGETGFTGEEAEAFRRSAIKEVAKAREEIETIKKSLAKVTEEARLAREEAGALKNRLVKESAKSKEKAGSAEEEIETLKATLAEKTEEACLAQEEAEALKRSLSKSKEEARLAVEETETLKATLEKITDEAGLTREEAEAFRRSSAKAREEARLAAEEIETLKAALAKTTEEAEIAREEAEAAKKSSAKEIVKIKEEAALSNESIEALKKNAAREIFKAREETRLVKAEAEANLEKFIAKADEELKLARQESELAIAKVNALAEEKARLTREEVDAIKKSSAAEVTKYKKEARQAREETEATKTASVKTIAKTNREVQAAREEAEETRTASLEAITRANKDTNAAREEAEESKTLAAEAVNRAKNEVRIAREEAEAAKSAVVKIREEARLAKEEAEEIKSNSAKDVARANKEIRLAREEAEDIKKACSKAIAKSSEEARTAREETEAAKAVVVKSREEAKLVRQEAEETRIAATLAIARANEEARAAKDEAAAARAESEAVILKMSDKLYHLDPMQSEFMSNIIHELRAPLHSILAFTKLLYEGDVSDTETQKEFYKIITDQSELLRKLIDELVDISPIESERFDLHKETVAMTELIQSCARDCYSLAKLKNISVTENIPLHLPEADVDSQRFKQLMFNLLGNAIKFSNENGSININVEAGNDILVIKITDHGIGIPAEAMPSLFEKYYQVKGTERVGGLGLGLYLSKRIVEAHGGEIRVESKEGSGSTFSFTIPLKQDTR
jgi:PAS domain S-box-containing protein